MSAVQRADEVSTDYMRFMRRVLFDSVPRKGKRAEDERRKQEAGYKALAKAMAKHFILGEEYDLDAAAVEAIKAAGAEIELDLPKELRGVVLGEDDTASKLMPAPPSAPKPKGAAAETSSSGRGGGRGGGRGSGRGSGSGGHSSGRRKGGRASASRQLLPEAHAVGQQALELAALQEKYEELDKTRRQEFVRLKQWGEAGWEQRDRALVMLKKTEFKEFAVSQSFFKEHAPPFAAELMSPPPLPRHEGVRKSPRYVDSVLPMQPLGEGKSKKRKK